MLRPTIVALGLTLMGPVLAGSEFALSPQQTRALEEIHEQIRRNWAGGYESKEQVYESMRRQAARIDRHSSFLSPEQYRRYKEPGGIGAYFRKKERGDTIKIYLPIPGMAAERAGLLPGDEILEIDGESTAPLGGDEFVAQISGPEGSLIELLVRRPAGAGGRRFPIALRRVSVRTSPVVSHMLDDRTGYLYLEEFSKFAPSTVDYVLDELKEKGMKALILDLRGNPGGHLHSAVSIASLFLERGDLIVTVWEKGHRSVYKSVFDGPYRDLPLAVLVDGQSASASEVLAAAFMHHRKAWVLGSKTAGKGTQQELYDKYEAGPLEGSALILTVGRWYTPWGVYIEGKGLTPHVETGIGEDEQVRVFRNIISALVKVTVDLSVRDRTLEEGVRLLGRAPPRRPR